MIREHLLPFTSCPIPLPPSLIEGVPFPTAFDGLGVCMYKEPSLAAVHTIPDQTVLLFVKEEGQRFFINFRLLFFLLLFLFLRIYSLFLTYICFELSPLNKRALIQLPSVLDNFFTCISEQPPPSPLLPQPHVFFILFLFYSTKKKSSL